MLYVNLHIKCTTQNQRNFVKCVHWLCASASRLDWLDFGKTRTACARLVHSRWNATVQNSCSLQFRSCAVNQLLRFALPLCFSLLLEALLPLAASGGLWRMKLYQVVDATSSEGLSSSWCNVNVARWIPAWRIQHVEVYTQGGSDVILFYIYASSFSPPCCRYNAEKT